MQRYYGSGAGRESYITYNWGGNVRNNGVGGSFHEMPGGSILEEHKRTKSKVDRIFGSSTVIN